MTADAATPAGAERAAPAVALATSLALGWATISLVTLGLAVAHVATHAALAAAALCGLAVAAASSAALRRGGIPATGAPRIIGLAALLATLPLLALIALPPSMKDDLIYHLLVPRGVATSGALAPDPYNLMANLPLLFELPLAVLMALAPNTSLFWPNFVVAGLLAWCVADTAWRRRGVPALAAALLGVAIVATPIVVDEAHSGYCDLFLALLVVLGLTHLEAGAADDRVARRRERLGLALLALAVGVKTFAAPALVLAAALVYARRRADGRGRALATALLPALLAVPFYLKNAAFYGNPLYPLASEIWPVPELSASRYALQIALADAYRAGPTLLDALLLPVRILLPIGPHPSPGALGFDGQLSLAFALAYVGALRGLFAWRRAPHATLAAAIFVAVAAPLAWRSQISRYFLPYALPLLGYGLAALARLPRRLALLAPAWLALSIGLGAYGAVAALADQGALDVVLRRTTPEAFLATRVGTPYLAAQALAARDAATDVADATGGAAVDRSRVLLLGIFGRGYYFRARPLSISLGEAELLLPAFDRAHPDPERFAAWLAREHVADVVVDLEFLSRTQADFADLDAPAALAWLDAHGTRIAATPRWAAWQLGAATAPAEALPSPPAPDAAPPAPPP